MNTNDDICFPINIGNPAEYTIKELAEKIINLTSSKSKIVCLPLPEDDPVKRKPDISKAKKFLNWSPEIDVTEGLKVTIEYYKNLLGII